MSARTLHQQAMELASIAFNKRESGQADAAGIHFRAALLLETEAAEQLTERRDLEPSRSVLFRSAATLALHAGEVDEAKRLAEMGLDGQPPEEIAEELREVLAKVEEVERCRGR